MSAGFGQAADGQGGGVAGKKSTSGQHGLGLLGDFGFELTLFKHRFDDEVAALQICRLVGGMDECQQSLLLVRAHAAFVHLFLGEVLAVGFAFVGAGLAHVFEHSGDAATCLRIGNA